MQGPPGRPQQQPQGPFTMPMDVGGGRQVEVCGRCRNPIPAPHSYQGPDNQIYKKKWCPSCGWIFGIKGPYRSHAEANPVVFK